MDSSRLDQSFKVVIKEDGLLDLQEGVEFVRSNQCGAINTFQGFIRDSDQPMGSASDNGKSQPIRAIFYDAYKSMAEKQIRGIVRCELQNNDPNMRVHISVRLGLVPVGQASISICASSTGRQESHDFVLTLLNQIKSRVTIWKKIIYTDGREQWAREQKSEAFWLSSIKT